MVADSSVATSLVSALQLLLFLFGWRLVYSYDLLIQPFLFVFLVHEIAEVLNYGWLIPLLTWLPNMLEVEAGYFSEFIGCLNVSLQHLVRLLCENMHAFFERIAVDVALPLSPL